MPSELKSKIEDKSARICIVGLGFVGLPTAVHFASKGFKVVGCDIKQEVIKSVNSGKTHISGLEIKEELKKVVEKGKLRATLETEKAVSESDIILIIVQTPLNADNVPNMSPVRSASTSVGKGLKNGSLVIFESTAYPGMTEEIIKSILEKESGLVCGADFGLAYSPERYNPGDVEHTLEKMERIVGGISKEWAEVTALLYSSIVEKVHVVKNIKTAEAAKVIENIQRDVNIALVNEFALVFDKLEIDVEEVLQAASTKWNFLDFKPGCGVGGGCLPKDPYLLLERTEKNGFKPKIITSGRSVNDFMPIHTTQLVTDCLNSVGKTVSGSKIALLGLSFKPGLGDLTNSPSLSILKELQEMGAKVSIYDSCVSNSAFKLVPIKEALEKADAVVVATAHKEIINLDLENAKNLMNANPVFVDGRNIFSPEQVKKLGFVYRGIGRR